MTDGMGPQQAPRTAKVALVNLGSEAATVLAECFKQFNIITEEVTGDVASRFQKTKFDAVVVRLDEGADATLRSIRMSTSNRTAVLYGIAASVGQALKYSGFGINATLPDPVDRQGALRVVRATHLLVAHELRRYVRIPVVTEVAIESNKGKFEASTIEISSGGMSLRTESQITPSQDVRATFTLPNGKKISVSSIVCWRLDKDRTFGLRFDPHDPGKTDVKNWVEEYLDMY